MDAYLQKFLHKFQHLKIPLEEIKSATDNFDDEKNCIGVGGFGKVYKGEVSHYKGRSMVAIKRLDRSSGQGAPEFLKEISTLSRYSHENLISLVGFCYQGEEMILVYEHASRGSFDRYLSSPHLTWSQRIKICLDAAKGLSHLHDPGETHQRLIHCDIKSSNILLDEQWNTKLSDLGLSIVGSANVQQSVIVTLAAGTIGYIDPLYMMTHTLTKESDVYSFGVVLFEVLCGMLCYKYSDGSTKILVPMWIESYKQRKLNDIIFKSLTVQPLDQIPFEIVSNIAYRCLNEYREDRPMMSEVITELKTALKVQEVIERMQLSDYEEITRSAEPPLNYSSQYGLWKLLMKGVLLNEGKTWFSLNEKGEHCEMISIAECLDVDADEFKSADNSRFAVGPYYATGNVKVRVKTQFLSPGITYTMNIMLRKDRLYYYHLEWVPIRYKLEGEPEISNSYIVYESDGGYWWICELYQFTSDQRDHEFLFEFRADDFIEVEGIDFRPVEEVEHTAYEKQPLSESDANWKEKLPIDYKNIMKRSKHSLQWLTEKEAYSILCKGLLITDGVEDVWASLDNDGKICAMSPARKFFAGEDTDTGGIIQPSPESRFGEVFEFTSWIRDITWKITDILSPSFETPYDVYLIYKLPKDLEIDHHVLIEVYECGEEYKISLASPGIPVIRPKTDQNTHNPMSRPKVKGFPRQRDDGWMEVQVWECEKRVMFSRSTVDLIFSKAVTGLIIEGVEFRPR